MRAIQVRCPNCAAILRAGADTEVVDCDYCHTQSRVQRRTRMLQIPVRLPPPPQKAGGPPPGRAARQVVRRAMLGFSALLTLLPIAVVAIVLYTLRDDLQQAAGTVVDLIGEHAPAATGLASRAGEATWVGVGPPLLADVDGDPIADLVGRVRYVHDGDRAHVAALSGATGKPLWQSPRLGTYSDTVQGRLVISGGVVVFAGEAGRLVGLDLRSGTERFSSSLPDRPARFCRAGDSAIAIQTADDRWHEVALAGGALRRPRSPPRCERLVDDGRGEVDPQLEVDGSPRRWKQPGMHAAREFRRAAGGPVVATGWRRPGTAVPMVARLDARGRATWKVVVPAGNPLEARPGSGGFWTMTERLVCGTYERTGGSDRRVHVTCFELEDGARAWDIAIPSEKTNVITSLVAAGDRLYLSGWGFLIGMDAATGRWMPGFAP